MSERAYGCIALVVVLAMDILVWINMFHQHFSGMAVAICAVYQFMVILGAGAKGR